MKKHFLLFLGLAVAFASCQKDPVETPAAEPTDILILNNGNWGASDASISSYDIKEKTVSGDVFFSVNQQKLGDLGQDIVAYKDYLLIAVNGSKTIFVTDKSLKIVATICKDYSPRYFCVAGDKIYVTLYEGFLGEIDPADWTMRTTAVGANPEGLAYVDGKIYVANSGGYVPGYCNTVSVVDLKNFKEEKTIEVNTNPNKVVAYKDRIYVTSNGDYVSIAAKLQMVTVSDCSVKDIDIAGVNGIALGGNGSLYVLSGEYDANWTLNGNLTAVDAATGKVGDKLVSGIVNAYSVSASGNYVFVGCSDYKTDGTLNIYNQDGTVYDSVCSEGLNPIAAIVL